MNVAVTSPFWVISIALLGVLIGGGLVFVFLKVRESQQRGFDRTGSGADFSSFWEPEDQPDVLDVKEPKVFIQSRLTSRETQIEPSCPPGLSDFERDLINLDHSGETVYGTAQPTVDLTSVLGKAASIMARIDQKSARNSGILVSEQASNEDSSTLNSDARDFIQQASPFQDEAPDSIRIENKTEIIHSGMDVEALAEPRDEPHEERKIVSSSSSGGMDPWVKRLRTIHGNIEAIAPPLKTPHAKFNAKQSSET